MERIFEAPNGNQTIAINEIQADVYIREGFNLGEKRKN
jgi:phenylpyruvate tautomerase PptA (4-oxalocrotonate tautomerase family)